MSADNRNIYQVARRAAGLTQEKAAELMGVPDRSLRAYEAGERFPPNEVVEAMCVYYNAQHLAYQHLHETNALMDRIVPKLEPRSLMEVAVRIYNRMERFRQERGLEKLMSIADDGIIAEDEKDEFDRIVADLTEIVQSGMELSVYCKSE